MSEELKPCPCTHKPTVFSLSEPHRGFYVLCTKCHKEGVPGRASIGATEAEAIADWNRRDDELARIGAATKAAAERDGVEREAMHAAMVEAVTDCDICGAAAAALVEIAKGESDAI